jgi:serine/threonine protein kinase
MDYRKRWDIIDELGEGGQGKVYRVMDKTKFDVLGDLFPSIQNSFATFSGASREDQKKETFETFRKAIVDMMRMENTEEQGALKVLHEPKDARDHIRAGERIKREIKGMDSITHPNLLKILDYDPDGKWYVSEFHSRGTLNNNKNLFIGNFVKSLRAFHPVVEAVGLLHLAPKIVHRDIKPENVFLDMNGSLIIGDFGLVFFGDDKNTRLSGISENVGSRDWMPPWAVHKRLEEVNPSFDVFCLGKLLWAMVSGSILPFWEFEEPEYNLEQLFSEVPFIYMANRIFKKCIVRKEEDCLPNALELLDEVDKLLSIIDRNGDLLNSDIERTCRVCGIGSYILEVDRNPDGIEGYGFKYGAGFHYKLFCCNNCGHVQLFHFKDDKELPAWSS